MNIPKNIIPKCEMVTCSLRGIVKPNPNYSIYVEKLPITEQKNVKDATNNSILLEAMNDELIELKIAKLGP